MTTVEERPADLIERVVERLHGVLRPDQVLTGKADRFNRARVPAPFPVHRWRERVPDLAVLPESTEDVAAVVRIANELAQAGEYGGVAIKVLDEQGNEVAYVPIAKRSD